MTTRFLRDALILFGLSTPAWVGVAHLDLALAHYWPRVVDCKTRLEVNTARIEVIWIDGREKLRCAR